MNRLLSACIAFSAVLTCSSLWAAQTPSVELPLSFSSNGVNYNSISLGLDTSAENYFDPATDNFDIQGPPMPPGVNYTVAITDSVDSNGGTVAFQQGGVETRKITNGVSVYTWDFRVVPDFTNAVVLSWNGTLFDGFTIDSTDSTEIVTGEIRDGNGAVLKTMSSENSGETFSFSSSQVSTFTIAIISQSITPPTASNPSPEQSQTTVAASSITNTVTAGDDITFSVDISPSSGETLEESFFLVATNDGTFDPSGVWREDYTDTANWPTYHGAGTDPAEVDFSQATGSYTFQNGSDFTWTQIAGSTAGTRELTWTVPDDLVTKNTATADRVFVVTIDAGQSNDGEVDQSWAVLVQPLNQAPTVTDSSPSGDTIAVNEGDSLDSSVTAADADTSDTLSYSWELEDSEGIEDLGVATSTYSDTVPFDEVLHTDKTYTATLRANITDGVATTTREWTVTVTDVNRAPNDLPQNSVVVTPSSPVTTDDLTCTVTSAGDPDDDSAEGITEILNYTYEWLKDGSLVETDGPTTATTATLAAAQVIKGSVYTCRVTVSDDPYGDDSGSLSSNETTSVGVTVGNTAPVAQNDSVFIQKGSETTASITLVAADADSDSLTYSLSNGTGDVSEGVISGFDASTGSLTYTVSDPTTEFFDAQADVLTFSVTDGTDTDTGTVTITYRENQPPEVVSVTPGTGTTPADQAADEGDSVVFNAQFTDDNDPSGIGEMDSIVWYLDSVDTGTTGVDYTFTTDFDTITNDQSGNRPNTKNFIVSAVGTDTLGASTTLTWTVTVSDINRTPSITGVALSVKGGGSAFDDSVLVATPAGWNDADGDAPGYAYAWYVNDTVISGQTGSTLQNTTTSEFFGKDDEVTVQVTPDDGRNANNLGTAQTSSTITIQNSIPTVTGKTAAVNDGSSVNVTLTAGAADTDGDSLSYSKIENPQHGTVSVSISGIATYTADWEELSQGQTDADTFTFKTNDGEVDSNTATVSVTVTGINDAPIADDKSAYSDANVTGDSGNSASIPTLSGSDVDQNDTLSFEIVSLPQNGTLTDAGDGAVNIGDTVTTGMQPLKFTPTLDFRGTASFNYKAVDNNAGESTSATVRITVGTPLWYPYFTDSDINSANWYQVQVWDDTPGATGSSLVVEGNVPALNSGGFEMTPREYFNAGSNGLLPGTYYYRYRTWAPSTNAYGDWTAETQLDVEDYGVAEAPQSLQAAAGSQQGEYSLSFIVPNASEYTVEITGPSGFAQTIPGVFQPDSNGVISLNQVTTVSVVLPTAGTYSWRVRGSNPLNTDSSNDIWTNGTDITVAQTLDTLPAPAQVSGLNPANGALIVAPNGQVRIKLSWQPVSGAATYVLYLGSTAGSPLYNYTNVGNATSVNVTVVPGSYSWMVGAVNSEGTVGTWTAVYRFDVIQNAAAPVIQGVTAGGANSDVLNITTASGSSEAVTATIYHFDTDSGQWNTYDVAVTAGSVSISGASFDAGEYLMIIGVSSTGNESPAKLFQIQ